MLPPCAGRNAAISISAAVGTTRGAWDGVTTYVRRSLGGCPVTMVGCNAAAAAGLCNAAAAPGLCNAAATTFANRLRGTCTTCNACGSCTPSWGLSDLLFNMMQKA